MGCDEMNGNKEWIANLLRKARGAFDDAELCRLLLLTTMIKTVELRRDLPYTGIATEHSLDEIKKIISEIERVYHLKNEYISKSLQNWDETNWRDAYEGVFRDFEIFSPKSEEQLWEFAQDVIMYFGENNEKIGIYPAPACVRQIEKITLGETAEKTIYDGFSGTGLSALFSAEKTSTVYLQDMDAAMAILSSMLLVIRGCKTGRIARVDSLQSDLGKDDCFDRIISEPPLRVKYQRNYIAGIPREHMLYPWINDAASLELRHMAAHLKNNGIGAVLVPSSLLYRSDVAAEVRANMLKDGYISAVIEFPAGLWKTANITTALVVLERKENAQKVFFINMEKLFDKDKGIGWNLSEEHLAAFREIYITRKNEAGVSADVPIGDIRNNEYGLSTAKYIFSERQTVQIGNIDALFWEIRTMMNELHAVEQTLWKKRGEFLRNRECLTRGGVEDVTNEYLKNARPNQGVIEMDPGYDENSHCEEIKVACWMQQKFGGDIRLITESKMDGEKRADYFWHQATWELKAISSKHSIDSQIHKAMKQIKGNGGIIIDIAKRVETEEMTMSEIEYRLWKRAYGVVDAIIIDGDILKKIVRIKKDARKT